MLAALSWDPDPVAFIVPLLGRPVAWYGILYALGALLGYWVTRHFVRIHLTDVGHPSPESRESATTFTDWTLWAVVIGTLVGARLGHVFCYSWEFYRDHLWDIVKVWEGGLSSHGSAVGGLIGLIVLRLCTKKRFPSISFLQLLDIVSVALALVGCCIRLGNFMNQELVGTVTTAPWAVIFGHAVDGSSALPRHPVQLYESLAYLAIFVVLYSMWRSSVRRFLGVTSGLFFILIFSSRFALEFFKEHVHSVLDGSALQMGQLLSVPFIVLGIILLARKKRDQWA